MLQCDCVAGDDAARGRIHTTTAGDVDYTRTQVVRVYDTIYDISMVIFCHRA